nr:hypothetical protein [Tanacetum cinerariifolium]
MQTQESKVDTGKVFNASLVITKSNMIESKVQDERNRPGNDTDTGDVDIKLIYDEEPMVEVQLTSEYLQRSYDSIKKTRVQKKDHNDPLIAQMNKKSIKNADLKAQLQENIFAIAALKNELRKLKGNSVDTKFEKPSILEKPTLQPLRNQSVVRQSNTIKYE